MSYEPLDRKYRPRTFEEVKGQERCVRYLSNVVLRKAKPRNVLLHGSVGSGKTSLARIYARAINCDSPTEKGSPCYECASCRRPDRDHWVEYDVSGVGDDTDGLRRWLENWNRTPIELKYRTLFLDEAHALNKKASDVLLKAVEEPAEGVVFVFATTEIERMRRALLSRLAQLEVMPLSPEESLRFLTRFANSERMTFDTSALSLLAGLKDNYPRDLLIGLEQVHMSSDEPITIARVKEEFDLDHTEALVDYLFALASGEPTTQMRLFLDWREPAGSKLRWIQSVLLSLYYNHIHSSQLIIDPLVATIDRLSTARILSAFKTRFNVQTNRDLHGVLRAMIEFWATPTHIASEGALLLRLTAFHEMVNAAGTISVPSKASTTSPHTPGRETFDDVRLPKVVAPVIERKQFPLGQERYITVSDVREIIRVASFLTQHYGHLFNARFELRPSDFGSKDEESAYRLIGDFCDELLSREAETFFITLVERDPLGMRAIVLAHVSRLANSSSDDNDTAAILPDIRAWAQNWRSADRTSPSPLLFEVTGRKPERRFADHRRNVLDLCAGLDPEDRLDGLAEPLLDLLGVKRGRRDPRSVRGPIFFTSPNLSAAAMDAAAANRMEFLSAFDDHAWGHVTTGWEMHEFKDRQVERARRHEEIARLEREYGAGTFKFDEKRAELGPAWPKDPRDRPRSWRGWWAPRQV